MDRLGSQVATREEQREVRPRSPPRRPTVLTGGAMSLRCLASLP